VEFGFFGGTPCFRGRRHAIFVRSPEAQIVPAKVFCMPTLGGTGQMLQTTTVYINYCMLRGCICREIEYSLSTKVPEK
jgi:hypothetical protein